MSTNPNDLNLFEKILSHLSFRDVIILGLLAAIFIVYQDRGIFYQFLQDEEVDLQTVGECLLVVERDNHYLVRGVSSPLAVREPNTQLMLMLRAESNETLDSEDFDAECDELTALTNIMEDATVETPSTNSTVTPYQP